MRCQVRNRHQWGPVGPAVMTLTVARTDPEEQGRPNELRRRWWRMESVDGAHAGTGHKLPNRARHSGRSEPVVPSGRRIAHKLVDRADVWAVRMGWQEGRICIRAPVQV